jgi:hypothetical protein
MEKEKDRLLGPGNMECALDDAKERRIIHAQY